MSAAAAAPALAPLRYCCPQCKLGPEHVDKYYTLKPETASVLLCGHVLCVGCAMTFAVETPAPCPFCPLPHPVTSDRPMTDVASEGYAIDAYVDEIRFQPEMKVCQDPQCVAMKSKAAATHKCSCGPCVCHLHAEIHNSCGHTANHLKPFTLMSPECRDHEGKKVCFFACVEPVCEKLFCIEDVKAHAHKTLTIAEAVPIVKARLERRVPELAAGMEALNVSIAAVDADLRQLDARLETTKADIADAVRRMLEKVAEVGRAFTQEAETKAAQRKKVLETQKRNLQVTHEQERLACEMAKLAVEEGNPACVFATNTVTKAMRTLITDFDGPDTPPELSFLPSGLDTALDRIQLSGVVL